MGSAPSSISGPYIPNRTFNRKRLCLPTRKMLIRTPMLRQLPLQPQMLKRNRLPIRMKGALSRNTGGKWLSIRARRGRDRVWIQVRVMAVMSLVFWRLLDPLRVTYVVLFASALSVAGRLFVFSSLILIIPPRCMHISLFSVFSLFCLSFSCHEHLPSFFSSCKSLQSLSFLISFISLQIASLLHGIEKYPAEKTGKRNGQRINN